uniref:Tyrosine-protein kinase receptor n=1 Tax=Parascaris univalens TaxID=6257 RepID=A0A915CE38_PARUN
MIVSSLFFFSFKFVYLIGNFFGFLRISEPLFRLFTYSLATVILKNYKSFVFDSFRIAFSVNYVLCIVYLVRVVQQLLSQHNIVHLTKLIVIRIHTIMKMTVIGHVPHFIPLLTFNTTISIHGRKLAYISGMCHIQQEFELNATHLLVRIRPLLVRIPNAMWITSNCLNVMKKFGTRTFVNRIGHENIYVIVLVIESVLITISSVICMSTAQVVKTRTANCTTAHPFHWEVDAHSKKSGVD